ncbi:DUF3604 domain-containing protein [Kordiimonas aquimaris]|uniref:DUF3604 domain-containing protein n=1 Tax=Kordiimonas aquimaris TaxID=707591 RepID=UPI0021D166D6|nr:DUF3604 domain-containing protein [Kordiimonas aquimaris]
MMKRSLLVSVVFASATTAFAQDEPTNVYWGDTHLHTSYSFDAFMNGNKTADPDTAYRWAKGQPVIHPYNRARVQLARPLDFLVVADHAELMGVIRSINAGTAELPEMSVWDSIKRWFTVRVLNSKIEDGTAGEVFLTLLPDAAKNPGGDPVQDPNNALPGRAFGDTNAMEKIAWDEIVDAAERHNKPGTFTSFIGWEWSSLPTGANLHRIVFSPTNGKTAKMFQPYGSDDSQYPQDLWQWLDDTSTRTGADFVSIPHNSNISKGYMFQETNLKGEPMTPAYAETRLRWEPVVEITQIKGDSETHPSLSPNDEFADFEQYSFYIQKSGGNEYTATKADFVRPALGTGLKIEENIGVNPFKFGVIGSTDSHSGIASADEDNFWGKMARDSIPENKGSFGIGRTVNGWNMAAQGLAAVWAEENNRTAIFNAFKRREVYATTGPRMRVRFFAGWDFSTLNEQRTNLAEIGYRDGVPMGGDIVRPTNPDAIPQFLIHAVKDPMGANLDRVQVIKGWLDADGINHEKIYDVAWSSDRSIGEDGTLGPVADVVDRKTGRLTQDVGAPELISLWQDPEFNADQRAFYYVRVLQVPTARHSLLDSIALQEEPPKEGPPVQQERAYTSAIWYTP